MYSDGRIFVGYKEAVTHLNTIREIPELNALSQEQSLSLAAWTMSNKLLVQQPQLSRCRETVPSVNPNSSVALDANPSVLDCLGRS